MEVENETRDRDRGVSCFGRSVHICTAESRGHFACDGQSADVDADDDQSDCVDSVENHAVEGYAVDASAIEEYVVKEHVITKHVVADDALERIPFFGCDDAQ